MLKTEKEKKDPKKKNLGKDDFDPCVKYGRDG